MTKKLKKFLATLLAMSMILSMASVSAFAADGDEPASNEPASNEPVIEDVVTGDNNENTPETCETCGKALTECEGHEDQTDPADTSEENEEEEEEQSEEELCEHEWNEGEAVEGGTKYTCALCGETHVLADEDNSFGTDTLEENGEENDGIDWAANEITIMTVDELIEFAAQVNGGTTFQGKTVTLGDDIDLNNEPWTPIGSNSKPFKGTFDGGGHTISNLNVTGDGYVGLFGYIGGNAEVRDLPEIRNLTVENVTVAAPAGNGVGGVVGNAFVAKVTNVHVTGTIDIEGSKWVGGIAGYGYVKIVDCSVEAEGNIKGNVWCVGGILGYGGEGTTTVENCTVEGTGSGLTIYSAYNALGGVVGQTAVNGAQHVTGSNLTVSNVKLESDIVWGGTNPGYFFGGSNDHELTGTLTAENVTIEVADEPAVIHDVVASVGSTYYASLQDAIDATATGKPADYTTVTLLRDTEESVTVGGQRKVKLDLNGCTLVNHDGEQDASISAEERKDTITVESGSTLQIIGTGTVDNVSHGRAALFNNGSVSLSGGAFTRSAENGQSSADNGGNSYYNIVNHGWMGIYSAAVTVEQDGGYSSLIENGYQDYADKTDSRRGYVRGTNSSVPSLNINNGTFSGGLNTIKNDDNGKLTIKGGTFTNVEQAAVLNWNIAEITGGTFEVNEGGHAVILNGYCHEKYDIGKLTISDGTFNGNGAPALKEMNGSTEGKWDDSIEISGGVFSSDVKDYVAEGLTTESDAANGLWTVISETAEPVAQVEETTYTVLQNAINNAYGKTVVLLKDHAENVTIGEGLTVTLDLNGKKLEGSSVNADYAAITVDGTKIGKGTVTNCGTLTIIDSSAATEEAAMGKIVGVNVVTNANTGATSGKIALVNMPNATCTIKSGMITRAPYLDETKTQNNGQTSNYTVQNMGTMNIEGGLIVNNSTYSNLVVNYTKKGNSYVNGFNAEMNISGGTLRQDTMSALKNDPGAVMNISGDAAVVWRVASENNYATNFYGTVNMTGGTIKTNGVIPLFTWKEGATEFPAQFNISGNAKLECNVLESNNGVMGGYQDAYVIDQQPVINISGNPTITVNRMQTVCSVDNVMTKVENRTKATINVEGGTFSTPVDPQYCAEGYLPIDNSDNSYGVVRDDLTITPNRTSQTGAGAVTLTVAPANLTAEVEVTCNVEGITLTDNEDGTWTTSRLPNRTVTYTFTVTVGTKTATCTVNVSYDAPYVPPVTEPDEDLGDDDTPLADRPWLFTDVKEGDYFYDAVKRLFDKGIVGGTTETTYEPYADATRGMVAQILYGMAGSPDVTGLEMPFTDVKESDFYYKAVLWGYANKVLGGYPEDNTFRGENTITREELAALLHQYGVEKLGLADTKSELDGFIDTDKISGWAVEHIKWAVGVEIMHGDNAKKLMPKDNTIRADMTIMLNNLDQMIGEEK